MPNLALNGQIPVQIDHVYSITATRLSVKTSRPTNFKAGSFGPIGIAQGIGPVTGSITFAVPETGLEFNLAALAAKPTGFTISYAAGASAYLIVGCKISDKDVSGDPAAGNTEVTVSFTGTEEIPA